MTSTKRKSSGVAVAGFLAGLAAVSLMFVSAAAAGRPSDDAAARLAFAITGAKVVAAPGRVFDPGVVVIRGGVIVAVGPEGSTSVPADARVLERKGKVVHAAYIDPYVTTDRLSGKRPRTPIDDEDAAPTPAPGAPPATNRAEERATDGLRIPERVLESYRRMGFAVVGAAPSGGVLRGRGAVLSLGEGPLDTRVLVPEAAQYVSLEPERFEFSNLGRANYPVSKMGAVAMVRQAFRDALWWRDAESAYAKRPAGQNRPRFEPATAALVAAATRKEPVVFDATDVLSLLRSIKVAREFNLDARFVGGGDEYRLRDLVVAAKPDLILRVDYPRPIRLEDEAEWLDVPLERLRRMDRSPSNPKWLRDAGVVFSLTTAGLDDAEDFPRRVREAIAPRSRRSPPASSAWRTASAPWSPAGSRTSRWRRGSRSRRSRGRPRSSSKGGTSTCRSDGRLAGARRLRSRSSTPTCDPSRLPKPAPSRRPAPSWSATRPYGRRARRGSWRTPISSP
jgi:hypothetical protein